MFTEKRKAKISNYNLTQNFLGFVGLLTVALIGTIEAVTVSGIANRKFVQASLN